MSKRLSFIIIAIVLLVVIPFVVHAQDVPPVPEELASLPNFSDGQTWGVLLLSVVGVLGVVGAVKPDLKKYTSDNRIIYAVAWVVGLVITLVGAYGFKSYPFGKDALSIFVGGTIPAITAALGAWAFINKNKSTPQG